MTEMGHSRLGGASWRSSHVRNAPLATVGPKKAACRDGPVGVGGLQHRSTITIDHNRSRWRRIGFSVSVSADIIFI